MKRIIKAGATSQTIDIFVQNSSSTVGAGLTGLAFNTANLVCYYRKGATGTATQLSLVTQTVAGAYTSGGFVEISAANMPGMYRLDLANAMLDTAGAATMMLTGAANMAPVTIELQIVAVDLNDTVRMGLTALPNAAAEASGGLITRGTSTGQLTVSSGTVTVGTNNDKTGYTASTVSDKSGYSLAADQAVNVTKFGGAVVTARDIGASVLLSSGTGTGQISLSSGTVTVGTNNDKAGYTASTVSDKTGYTVSTVQDKSGYSLAADQAVNVTKVDGVALSTHSSGLIPVDLRHIVGAAVNSSQAQLGVNTVTNADKTGYTASTVSDKTGYSLAADQAVNVTKFGGTTVTGRDIGASVLLSSGTGTGQLSLSSGTVTVGTNNDKTGYTVSTVSDKSGYSLAANQHVIVDSGTVTTLTNVLDVWSALLTSITVSGSIGKLLKDNVDAAVSTRSTYAGGDTSGVTTLLSRISGALTTDNIADAVWDEVLSGHTGAGSAGLALAGASAPSAAAVADAVWDELLSGHAGAGSAGLALATASSGGVDPSVLADAIWDEAMSGHSVSGTAGEVLSAVKTQTDKMNFTGTDIQATLDGETVTVGTNNDKTGYTVSTVSDKTGYSLAADQAVNVTKFGGTVVTGRDIGASVLLSNGTGTGQISLSTGRVTVGTNNDKTGYTVSTVSDKSGYSLAANQHVIVDSGTVTTLTNAPGDSSGVTTLLSRVAGTIAAGTHNPQSGDAYGVVNSGTFGNQALKTLLDTTGIKVATNADKTGYSLVTAPPTAQEIKTALEGSGSHLALILEDTGATIPASMALESTLSAMKGTTFNSSTDSLEAIRDYTAPASTALNNATWTDTMAGYLDASISSRLASSSYVSPDNAGVAAIKVATDQMVFTTPGKVDATAAVSLSNEDIQTIADTVVEGLGTVTDPLENALPGGYAPGTVGYAIAEIKANMEAGNVGVGPLAWTYTITYQGSGEPIPDVDVWISTDEAGANIIRRGKTNVVGVATFYFSESDRGSVVYVWCSNGRDTFTNPDREVIT